MRPRPLGRVVAVAMTFGLMSSPLVWAQIKKGAGAVASGVAPGWTVKVDPPGLSATLPPDVTPAIIVPGGEGVLYATSPSPFVAIGNNDDTTSVRQVVDLRTGQAVGAIRGKIKFTDKARLSPDGEYMLDVADGLSKDTQGVQVWSFKTGGLVNRFNDSDHLAFIYLLDFAGPGKIISTLSHGSGRFDIWDIATGKKARSVAGDSVYTHETVAFSPGRRTLAVANPNAHVLIYDLTTGRLAGDLAVTKRPDLPGRTKSLRFSPDGTELCALVESGRDTRLLVWTVAKPEIVVDHTFVGDPKHMAPGSFSYKGPDIEWLPDGSAWLLHGHVIVDRAGGRPVWMLRTAKWFLDPGPRRMIDNDRVLVVTGPDKAKRLEVVTLPWPKIDASVKAMESPDVPAFVRPGGSVSLKVEVSRVQNSTTAAVREELTKVLTSRLMSDGIKVADGQSAVLHARYGEATGETLHEVQRQGGPGPFAQMTPTGRSVQATKGACWLTWEVMNGKLTKAVWGGQVEYNPLSMTVRGNDLNNATVRAQMFEGLKYQLAGEPIPFFVPKDETQSILPGMTLISDAPLSPVNRAVPKATTRGKTTSPPASKGR